MGQTEVGMAGTASRGPAAIGLALLAATAATLQAASPVLDSADSFWHWDLGRRILDGGLPTVDPYSFLAAGRPWVLNQWGTEAIFGLLDWAGGLWLAALATALLAGATIWFTGMHMLRRAGSLTTVVLTGLVLLAIQPATTLRGSLFTLLLLPLLLRLLERDRPPLWLTGLLFVAWANLHAGFLLGIMLVLIDRSARVLLAPRGQRRTTAQRGAALLGTGLLASLATPYGWRLYSSGLSLVNRGADAAIVEWGPTPVTAPLALAYTVLVATVLVSIAVAATYEDLPDILVVVAVALFGYAAIRNLAPAAIVIGAVGAPYVQSTAASLLKTSVRPRRPLDRTERALMAVVLVVGMLAAVAVVPRTDRVASHAEDLPLDLTAQLDALDREARVVVPSAWAPVVATLTGPHVRTGVDGRLELFSDTELQAQWAVERGARHAIEVLDQWCATDVLALADSDLRALVADDPRWTTHDTETIVRNAEETVEWFAFAGSRSGCPTDDRS